MNDPTTPYTAPLFIGEKSPHCNVRSPLPDDYERIALLAGQLGYPSSASQIQSRMEEMAYAECGVLVADLPSFRMAGWIAVYIFRSVELEPCTVISGFVVDEAYRGRGVGTALLAAAEDWAREHRCTSISVLSNVVREAAHQFYDSHGYLRTKTQTSFAKELAAGTCNT